MNNLNFDVIICGGGPGGSACAMGFADTNIKVAVIEKSSFPRDKVCGDGMAPYIQKALYKMSPKFKDAFDDFKERMPIENVKIVSYNGKSVTGAFAEPWFVSTRYHFDNFLYSQASALPNVSFFLDEQVLNVTVTESGVLVKTNMNRIFTARLIIGCDGSTSIVRRQLTSYRIDLACHCIAVRAYYADMEDVQPNTFEFHFIPQYPNGYFWIFPSEDGRANAGFGIFSEDVKIKKLSLTDVFLEIIEQTPHLKSRFKNARLLDGIKGWSIPMGYEKHAISGSGFMLAGDAASIADPMWGEGIGQAIVTGRIAAFHAKECFARNDFSSGFMKTYDSSVKKKWGKQNRNHRFLGKYITSNQRLVNMLIDLSNQSNYFSRFIIRAISKVVN